MTETKLHFILQDLSLYKKKKRNFCMIQTDLSKRSLNQLILPTAF